MSRSDWLKLAKVVGLGFGGLAAFLFVLFVGHQLGASGGYYDAQHNGYAAQYPSDTDQRIRRCFAEAQPPSGARQCVEEAVKAAHESARAESDLSAQRQMANWAFWLLIATLGSIPLTAVGLILLLKTIWQGQEALKHSQDVSRDELRPWVDFTVEPYSINLTEDKLEVLSTLSVKNYGKTPALRVRYGVRIMCVHMDDADDILSFFESAFTEEGKYWERTLAPGGEGKFVISDSMARSEIITDTDEAGEYFFPMLIVNVAYTWPDSDTGGLTSRAFMIGPPGDDDSVTGSLLNSDFPIKGEINTADRGFSHAT